jgi:hypothetical protein
MVAAQDLRHGRDDSKKSQIKKGKVKAFSLPENSVNPKILQILIQTTG